MKTYRVNMHTTGHFSPSAACIGLFDGIHLGHAKLAEEALKTAENKSIRSAVITFDPDPREVYLKGVRREHLITNEMKYSMFERMGFDRIYIIEFDEMFCQMQPDDFIRYLNRLNVKELICGFDFSFGYRGKGNSDKLLQSTDRKFNVTVLNSVDYLDQKISSSRILKELDRGDIETVSALLGYSYTVVTDRNGRLHQHLPSDGNYLGRVKGKNQPITIEKGVITEPLCAGEMTLVFEKRI